MRAVGIVRHIDDLGRIVIPREIRRSMRIREGDPMEIFLDGDCIAFKKYSPLSFFVDHAHEMRNALSVNHISAAIFDSDKLLSGPSSFKISIPPDEWSNISQPATAWKSMFITPIFSDGGQIGFICYKNLHNDESIHEIVKLVARYFSNMAER